MIRLMVGEEDALALDNQPGHNQSSLDQTGPPAPPAAGHLFPANKYS